MSTYTSTCRVREEREEREGEKTQEKRAKESGVRRWGGCVVVIGRQGTVANNGRGGAEGRS